MAIVSADLETGDLSQFDYVDADGGDLSVDGEHAAHGVTGLSAYVDDTYRLTAYLDMPAYTNEGWSRFAFKIGDDFSQPANSDVWLVRMHPASGYYCAYALLHRKSDDSGWTLSFRGRVDAEYRWIGAADDAGVPVVVDRWYAIEFHWKRASGAGVEDGEVHVWVDGVLERYDEAWPSYSSMNVKRLSVELKNMPANVLGHLYFDDLVCSSDGRVYPIRGRSCGQVNRVLGPGIGRQIT